MFRAVIHVMALTATMHTLMFKMTTVTWGILRELETDSPFCRYFPPTCERVFGGISTLVPATLVTIIGRLMCVWLVLSVMTLNWHGVYLILINCVAY